MAFPTIPTTGAGTLLSTVQANTTAARTFPSLSSLTKSAGDLLIAVIAAYESSASAAFSSWGAGFTEIHDVGGSAVMATGVAYKFSTGSETGTFTVTQAATITGHAAMFLMSISGAHASSPPEVGTRDSESTIAADPGPFDPSWGAEDILWISVGAAGETSTAGSFTGIGSNPTNYGDFLISALSGDVIGGVRAGIAFRQLNADSEDVGTWAPDLSNARNVAFLMAVRPAAEAVVDMPQKVIMPEFAIRRSYSY